MDLHHAERARLLHRLVHAQAGDAEGLGDFRLGLAVHVIVPANLGDEGLTIVLLNLWHAPVPYHFRRHL